MTESVFAYYNSNGWEAMKFNALIDFAARKGNKLHFVKVTKEPMYGVDRNNFVQNAFSNNAIAVNAYYVGDKLKLVDMNTNSGIRIAAKKAKPDTTTHAGTHTTTMSAMTVQAGTETASTVAASTNSTPTTAKPIRSKPTSKTQGAKSVVKSVVNSSAKNTQAKPKKPARTTVESVRSAVKNN